MTNDLATIYAERLASVRARITVVRGLLADASTASELAIDGVSEKFNRDALRAELKDLEAEELRLLQATTGRSSRLFGIVIR